MRVLALSSAQLPAGFSLDGGGSPLAPPYPWMTLPLQDVGFYLSDGSHSCTDARRKSPTPSTSPGGLAAYPLKHDSAPPLTPFGMTSKLGMCAASPPSPCPKAAPHARMHADQVPGRHHQGFWQPRQRR